MNHSTYFAYDKLGRRTSRYLPADSRPSGGERWFYDWDFAHARSSTDPKRPNVIMHLDFKNQMLFMVYDSAGRLAQKAKDSTTPLVTYDYTAAGERARMTD